MVEENKFARKISEMNERIRQRSQSNMSNTPTRNSNGGQTPPTGGNNSGQTPPTGGNTGGQTPPTGGNNRGQNRRKPVDGVSNAYANDGIGEFDKTKKTSKAKDKILPPKREKDAKVDGNEKNIMELFWKEFIMKFYGEVVNTCVNIPIGFLEYVLYSKLSENPKEEETKTDVNKIGEKVYKEKMENPTKNKQFFEKAHQEIVENLEKEGSGIPSSWNVWRNEPTFYSELKRIKSVAEADPNSQEARDLQEFMTLPKIANGFYNKENITWKSAIMMSVLDARINNSDEKEKKQFKQIYAKMETDRKNTQLSKDDLSTVIIEDADMLINLLGDKNANLKQVLENIKREAQNNNLTATQLRSYLDRQSSTVKKEGKFALENKSDISKIIKNDSELYYNKITKNLDKIYRMYEGNPDILQEESKKYVEAIVQSIQDTREKVKKSEDRGIPGVTKRSAKNSLKNTLELIDGYVMNGVRIGDLPEVNNPVKSPLNGNTIEVMKAIKNYGVGM